MEILIIDNSCIINSRLKSLIAEAYSHAIIYQANSFKEAIEFYTEKKLNVVILDSGLPGSRSVYLLNKIKKVDEKTVVIVLSLQCDTLTRQKFTNANFFLDKYHEFEKITEHINAIESNIKQQIIMKPTKNQL